MANITEEHLHHLARRHHATMKKLDGMREKFSGVAGRFVGTVETGVAAWLGGAIEGRTDGGTVLNIPINLGVGAILLALAHAGPGLDLPGAQLSGHLQNLGNGFLGSYVAATGYSFGKRWKDTGKILGGHSWTHPYAPAEAPVVHGDLTEGQMAGIVARMQQAARAPAHP